MAMDSAAAQLGPETLATVQELGLKWSDKVRGEADIEERDRRTVEMAREKPGAISQMALFVTQDCNMRCPYCYGDGGGYGGRGSMSEETAFRAVDWLIGQAGDARELTLSFFGGEPLLNIQLIEKVVAYGREKAGASRKLEFAMTSNLSLLDDRILDFLVANKIGVMVSFDGPRHIQNRNRPLKNGRDSYETVVPKIRKLLAVLTDSHVRSTLAAGDDPEEVARELRALGFRRIYIEAASGCLITGSRAPSDCVGSGTCPREALTGFHRAVTSGFRQAVVRRDANQARPFASLGNLEKYFQSFLNIRDLARAITRQRRYFFCGRAMTMVAIAANGDIYPCHRFVGAQGFRMGNVYTGEFCRDGLLSSPVVENPECASCWARYLCGGNCQHDNATATGDPMRPDPYTCADRRSRIEYAIYAADCLDPQDCSWLAGLGLLRNRKCLVDF